MFSSHILWTQGVFSQLLCKQRGMTQKVSEWPTGWLPYMPTYGYQTDKFLQDPTSALSEGH